MAGPGGAARQLAGTPLADALQASRRDTLATFANYEEALRDVGLRVPQRATLNPPLWELGHIGWFQEFWLSRNPQRHRGAQADPDAARLLGVRADADRLYNSSLVAHASRWSLPLPDAAATRTELALQLERTLALLDSAQTGDDNAAYFFRLALFHEDMHHEAALYMARHLDIDRPDPRWEPPAEQGPRDEIVFDAARLALGSAGTGFAFDNELASHDVALPAYRIDRRAVAWREFLPFVEERGYGRPRWWCAEGRRWLSENRPACPRYLRRDGSGWLQRRHGRWQPLPLDQAACHVNAFEARAWCSWAGRRLPTEAEWEHAALERPADFAWGSVWEWTASPFAPYPGFTAHPYRDYSRPWFDGRPVLRGASFLTQPRMRHARYRNYFTPERNDITAGFRSCAAACYGQPSNL